MSLFWQEKWDSRVEKRKQEDLENKIQKLKKEKKRLKEQINVLHNSLENKE